MKSRERLLQEAAGLVRLAEVQQRLGQHERCTVNSLHAGMILAVAAGGIAPRAALSDPPHLLRTGAKR